MAKRRARAVQPEDAAGAKYTVLYPVKYDGDLYLVDDEIQLEDSHAADLLAVGAIKVSE